MRAVWIVNRRARHLRADDSPLLRRYRRATRVFETWDLDDLGRAVDEIARDKPDAVVLAGGDGACTAGVTALDRAGCLADLAVGIARGGTVCTIGANVGFVEDPEDFAEDARGSRGARLARVHQPTLRVNDRVGFIFGAGLVPRFFEAYDAAGAPGTRGAAWIVARIFGGAFTGGALAARVLTPQACAVDVDGVAAPFDEISLVAASVVRDLGLGMRVTYRAGEARDAFHFVATPLPPRRLAPQIHRVLTGRSLRGARVDALARRATLRFPATTGAYVLDGELVHEDVVEVSAGPVVRLVRSSG